jgi:hypothetical protein
VEVKALVVTAVTINRIFRFFQTRRTEMANKISIGRMTDIPSLGLSIWEVEYSNGEEPVELRHDRGKKYMQECPNTILFIRASIYSRVTGEGFEAAIVLWGKGTEDDTVSVLLALSFGTQDLSEAHKAGFWKTGNDRLVGGVAAEN